MGDNNSSRSDPCESGLLEVWTEENPLDCLQQFRRGLVEDRRQEYMLLLRLHLEDLTQEVVAAVVKVFQVCYTKGIQWKTLDVWLPADNNQNRFLHLILSEARRLRQFKEVDLKGLCSRAALTNEIAKELRAMMSSEQGIERLKLTSMRLLPGVLTALSEGLRANRVVELGLYAIPFMEREVMVDGEINEYNGEGQDGEIAYFIEGLRQNTSLNPPQRLRHPDHRDLRCHRLTPTLRPLRRPLLRLDRRFHLHSRQYSRQSEVVLRLL
jgi:hypothetical protein